MDLDYTRALTPARRLAPRRQPFMDYYLLDCYVMVNVFIMFYLLLHVGMKKEASHVLRKH
jgi:hypothetical protein